jgi:hypothetical protein
VEASTLKGALGQFRKFKGAQVGSKNKALELDPGDKSQFAIKYPSCELLHKNRRGRYICGEENSEEDDCNGQYGMCIMDGSDPPDNCPINDFMGKVYAAQRRFTQEQPPDPESTVRIVEIRGFRVVMLKEQAKKMRVSVPSEQ